MFIKAKLAAFAYAEAAHCGGFDSMLAVACVVRNRVRKGWFGGDWLKVIANAGDAASLMYPPEVERPPILEDLTAPGFRRVLQEVDDIFLGMFKDTLTEGGLYYMNLTHAEQGQVVRPWFAEKILRDPANHPRKAQVSMIQIFS